MMRLIGCRHHLAEYGVVAFESSHMALASRVSKGYTSSMVKDSGLRIRVERELREKFLALCREQDKPAAQVIREFMRDYLSRHTKLGRKMQPTNDGGVARHSAVPALKKRK
jgi:hypothetical protein